jgi:hypothetical protein
MSTSEAPTDFRQRAVDLTVVSKEFDALPSRQTDIYHRARLLALASEHSGDWLHALPIAACGIRLDNEAIRVAINLASVAVSVNPTDVIVAPRLTHAVFMGFPADAAPADNLAIIISMTQYGEHSHVPAFLPPRNPTVWSERMANDPMD